MIRMALVSIPLIIMAHMATTTPAAAQIARRSDTAPPAWLGFGYEVRWVQDDGSCRPEVMVETLVEGAPAERAGLRAGDAIVALDGEPVGGHRLRLASGHLNPGDSVRLRIQRQGTTREIVAVADRRPPRPPVAILMRETDGFARSSAPVVEVAGDRIIVRNVETLHGWSAGPGGYWVADDDGRTEWRRLAPRAGGDMDRRVRDLLACAERSAVAPEPFAVAQVDPQRIRRRADSLSMVIARRALERRQNRVSVFRALEEEAREDQRVVVAPTRASVFRFEDHVRAAERGVAGAELTPLEPELAEYFRGARSGLLVLRVAPGSPASVAGLVPGDVITSADGRAVASIDDFRLLVSLPDPSPLELRVVRKGRSRSLTIRRE